MSKAINTVIPILNRAFFRKCVTAVWVKDKVQHDHRIQS